MQATHRLDAVFAALADPTRRAIIARLASGQASVNELARPFAMSQPAISKHLKVLERAGLISGGREAQRRPRRREAKAPERLVSTEKFDDAWYPGESLNTLVLVEKGGRTTLTQTMRYESREAREAVIKSGMEQGVAASYDRLDDVLAATANATPR